MGSLGDMFREANLSSEFNENNEDLVAALNKLTDITKMFVDTYSDVVVEVHASPLDLIQTKLKDISKIKVYVVYVANFKSNDDSCDRVSDAKEMLNSLHEGEVEDVSGGYEIVFSTKANWNEPTVLLYSVFAQVHGSEDTSLENVLSPSVYWSLYELVFMNNYTVSYPVSIGFMKSRGLFIHCGESSRVVAVEKMLERNPSCHTVAFTQTKSYKVRDGIPDYYYVPILKMEPMGYGLPYVYVTRDSFNKQYLEKVLNTL